MARRDEQGMTAERALVASSAESLCSAVDAARRAGRPALAAVAVDGNAAEALLTAGAGRVAFCWRTPGERAYAGAGQVLSCGSVDDLASPAAADALAEAEGILKAVVAVDAAAARISPRAFAGASFGSRRDGVGAWRGWERGQVVVPRWHVDVRAGRATLALLALPGDPVESRDALLREALVLLAAVTRPPAEPPPAPPPRLEPADRAAWNETVGRALAHISEGACDKLVVARAARVTFAQAPDPRVVLARLAAAGAGAVAFGVRTASGVFVGASPETLVRRSGLVVEADALAGTHPFVDGESVSAGDDAKLAREHGLVVDSIRECLAPLCREIEVPGRPTERRAGPVSHLFTPVAGVLTRPVHVLALAARLHPTPAVAGTPPAAAREWIEEHEPVERGWYAGPIGWFDASGDGEFAVALRSALLRGRHALAYAGAGIVRGSRADDEFEETELKLRPMLDALGARGAPS